MRKNNELNIFKSQKNNPRILKISQLIKKTLSEVFLTLDFTDEEGESVIFFINEVSLSRDARIATIFITNFSNKKLINSQQLKNIIDNNLSRIKRENEESCHRSTTYPLIFIIKTTIKKILLIVNN